MKLVSYVPGTRAWRSRRDILLCRKAMEQIDEIVDGEIRGNKAAKLLERHLDACERCHGEAEVVRSLKQAIARVGKDADPEFIRRLEELGRRLCEGTEAR
jgi:anti-sigma factor RsiW